MGTGVIINGQRELVPGMNVENWLDNPVLRLRSGEDFRQRKDPTWLKQIILHTTKGIPGGSDQREQVIHPGLGPSVNAGERCARWWSKSPESAGAHLVVDFDGRVFCCVDLRLEAAMHARHANQTSIGIEIYQGSGAEMYEGQLEVVVRLVDWLTRRFGIQRQIPHRYVGPSRRLLAEERLQAVVGVFGHRDLATNRGRGDPGNRIMNMLGMAGYEDMDFDNSFDLDIWRRRQRDLGMANVDGIPGPITCNFLKAKGRGKGETHVPLPAGLWVTRPGDGDGPLVLVT